MPGRVKAMNDPRAVPDIAERRLALTPDRSFIVQAPAGSGKTELLIQRCLVLLARVERPEEIAAITFTRKAAAEMRKRIFGALRDSRTLERPERAHEAMTWDLAREVLRRNDQLGWRLEESAARLRVQTIDSLCASLTRQMPVLAKFGAQPESLDDASELYREAARATLDLLEEDAGFAGDVARLLGHLDNDAAQAEALIAGLLSRRDHWLRYLAEADQRESLEKALSDVRREAVERAAALLASAGKAGPEGAGAGDADAWIGFANELLTKDGKWRKAPALAKALADDDGVLAALRTLQQLPPGNYRDDQWETLGALARIAKVAVGQLKVVFATHGQADFVEIAQGALRALGTEDRPTDLLLSLDYRIHHILVDEFQDTSLTQYKLLEMLTAGWEPGDGRTLFVVGDPMQSIYRFREADVGLFLRARREGIGTVALDRVTLSANFRSQSGIVDWVNDAFARVMPQEEDIPAGAVTYAPSHAVHDAMPAAVTVHPFFNGDRQGEAERVVALARAALAQPGLDPGQPSKVAILVRGRPALGAIVPALKAAMLPFRAIEIDPLHERPVVRDLLSLTRALSHFADRVAWLAILRAPWCGLTLSDLHSLAGIDAGAAQGDAGGAQTTIRELMRDESRLRTLSANGRERLVRLRGVLEACIANRARQTLRCAVEGAWLALGGPACVEDATDLEDAEAFLDHLEQEEEAGILADLAAFEEGLAKLYALPDLGADDRLQVMTIHKAKGLEFDTVIVPGLGAGAPPDKHRLFLWLERAGTRPVPAGSSLPPAASSLARTGRSGLLLAPIRASGGDKDRIYEYIRALDKRMGDLENGRLLYVAATRAKKQLHLLGDSKRGSDADPLATKGPKKGSLLAKLWPVVERDFAKAPEQAGSQAESLAGAPRSAQTGNLARLRGDFRLPAAPPDVAWRAAPRDSREPEAIEFSWAGETARHVGTVVHRWLQCIADDAMKGWNDARILELAPRLRADLQLHGVLASDLDEAARRVERALTQAIADPRGRWVLGPHAQAATEHRVTVIVDGARRMLAMDRLFRDADGTRWIVDYKTSSHEGAQVEAFLDRERERYAPQLRAYATALGDARTGLYFPLIPGWREMPR
jgi:ATP-dependent exoDNAse (exonuclease V) beta subunit